MNLMKLFSLIVLTSVFSGYVQAADTLYDQRFMDWQKKAKNGNAFAQYSLGCAYLRGNEVKADINKALYWFKAAARQDHAKSEYKLGYIYYSGKGISRNYPVALRWFLRGARRDYSPAQFYAGKMYADGKGTEQDTKKAMKWLNKARRNDYSPAAREIKRIASIANKTPATPVAKRKERPSPRKKTVAAKKVKPGNLNTAARIMKGKWLRDGEPAEIFPSRFTKCSKEINSLNCTSKELNISNPFAEIRYLIEAKFTRITKNGSFLVTWRKNILFVLPSDPDDPDVDPDTIPVAGWTQPAVMKCKLKGRDKASCSTDEFLKVEYKRKS